MSASQVAAPPRQLDLLMPDGYWYRTSEKFPDNEHDLEPLFCHHGTFIACFKDAPKGEVFVRASNVQAIRWVSA